MEQLPERTPSQSLQNSKIGNELLSKSKVELLRLADSERKIAEVDAEQVKSCIKYIMVLLGLGSQDIPDEVEKVVLIDFIYSAYGNRYSLLDLSNAFKHAVAGDFEVDLNFYGKRFSAPYFNKVMQGYSEYKHRTLAAHKPKIVEQPKPEPTVEDDEKLFKIFENYTKTSQQVPQVFDVQASYRTLCRLGLFKDEKLNDFEVDAIRYIDKSCDDIMRRRGVDESLKQRKRMMIDLDYYKQRSACIAYWFSLLSSTSDASGSKDRA